MSCPAWRTFCLAACALVHLAAATQQQQDLARAVDLPAGSASLAALAETWRGREAELIALLRPAAAPRPVQRGAARLLSRLPARSGAATQDTHALLEALIATDPELRRLALPGLLAQASTLSPTDALRLPEPAQAMAVLHRLAAAAAAANAAATSASTATPAQPNRPPDSGLRTPDASDPLAHPQVLAALRRWYADAQAADAATLLLAAHGTLATHGELLIEVIIAAQSAPRSATASAAAFTTQRCALAAHHALEQLTRTQRSFTAYAGEYDLLARDWRDVLASAKAGAAPATDSEALVLIADLPRPEALRGLLSLAAGKGDVRALLAALDAASSVGVDKARRRALADAARLVARQVTPGLLDDLGERALDGLDAAEPATRLALLKTAAESIRRRGDGPGLIHLVTYLDDRDASVRVSACDRLVRLSDDPGVFAGGRHRYDAWHLGKGLFPSAAVLPRLRRLLKEGSSDERIAALTFAVTLHAADVRSDAVALLLAADPQVVDSALDALGHLHVQDDARPALLRLASDAAVPAPRRVKALGLFATSNRDDDFGSKTQPRDDTGLHSTLERLLTDRDPLIVSAAMNAQIKLSSSGGKADIFRRVIATGDASRIVRTISLMAREDDSTVLVLLVPLTEHADAAVAEAALLALASKLREGHRERTTITALIEGKGERFRLRSATGAPALRAAAISLASAADAVQSADLLALLPAFPDEARLTVFTTLLSRDRSAETLIAALPQLGSSTPALVLAGRRALSLAALDPAIAVLLPRLSAEELLQADDRNTDYGHRKRSTFRFDLGSNPNGSAKSGRQHLILESSSPMQRMGDDRLAVWTIVQQPDFTPTAATRAALRAALVPLHVRQPTSELGLALAFLDAADAAAKAATSAPQAPGPAVASFAAPALPADWAGDFDAWLVLAELQPAVRSALAARLNADATIQRAWQLRHAVRDGDPDLLPTILRILGSSDGDDHHDWIFPWLLSLPADRLGPVVDVLATQRAARMHGSAQALLAKSGPLPLAIALPLLRDGVLGGLPLASFEAAGGASATGSASSSTRPNADTPSGMPPDALALLRSHLADLDPPTLTTLAPGLRRLRDAGRATFDAFLKERIATGDARAAAWLRTGLPMTAGFSDAYRDALNSAVPELWLVGAALALKEQRLSAETFLARVATLPATVHVDAASAARRYLEQQLAAHGPALAAILAVTNLAGLSAWLPLCPPAPEIETALTPRLRDPTTAARIAVHLSAHLRDRRDAWLPITRRLLRAANGSIDYVLPAVDRTASEVVP